MEGKTIFRYWLPAPGRGGGNAGFKSLALIFCALCPPLAAAAGRPTALIALAAKPDVPRALVRQLEQGLRDELAADKTLELWPAARLAEARRKLAPRLGRDCRRVDCLAELGRALRLDFIVTADVQRLEDGYQLEATLLDVGLAEDLPVDLFLRGGGEDLAVSLRRVGARLREQVPEFSRREKEQAAAEQQAAEGLRAATAARQQAEVDFRRTEQQMKRRQAEESKQRQKAQQRERARKRRELYAAERRRMMQEAGVKGPEGGAEALVIVPAFFGAGGLVIGLISHLKYKGEQDALVDITVEEQRRAQQNEVDAWRQSRDIALTVGGVGTGLSLVALYWYKRSGHSFTLQPRADGWQLAGGWHF